jgi:hypothetical protein
LEEGLRRDKNTCRDWTDSPYQCWGGGRTRDNYFINKRTVPDSNCAPGDTSHVLLYIYMYIYIYIYIYRLWSPCSLMYSRYRAFFMQRTKTLADPYLSPVPSAYFIRPSFLTLLLKAYSEQRLRFSEVPLCTLQ